MTQNHQRFQRNQQQHTYQPHESHRPPPGNALELAQATGVGYLPATLSQYVMATSEQQRLLHRWTERLILVEGAFDRLTLRASGFQATEVVALVGTAAQPGWFPKQVKTIILALDADEGGTDAMRRLAERFERTDYRVKLCPPVQDKWGKDWNERWQRIGSQSVWPLYAAMPLCWLAPEINLLYS